MGERTDGYVDRQMDKFSREVVLWPLLQVEISQVEPAMQSTYKTISALQ